MILANKFSASIGQNYALRRNTYVIKDNFGDYLVDLYGENWNRGIKYDLRHYLGQFVRTPIRKVDLASWYLLGTKQRNYFGQTKDKAKTASQYRINLVIENSREYVSEKLFEAHLSQNIVVYVGASLQSENINPALAIQCKPKIDDLVTLINSLNKLPTKIQYKIMKDQQQIAKLESKKRFNTSVLRNLASSIAMEIKRR